VKPCWPESVDEGAGVGAGAVGAPKVKPVAAAEVSPDAGAGVPKVNPPAVAGAPWASVAPALAWAGVSEAAPKVKPC
jgi:hypothetical protein